MFHTLLTRRQTAIIHTKFLLAPLKPNPIAIKFVLTMKRVINICCLALLLCAFGNASALAQQATQQSDQVAIQLGALQLGIADIATATPQQQANALYQGRAALRASETNFNLNNFVLGATCPAPQSPEFRAQLETAVQNALANPVNIEVSGRVSLVSGRSVRIGARLNPSATKASAILEFALARIPNTAPGLVINSIEAAVAVPQKFGTPGTGLADANRLAQLAMERALKTYVTGTRQWGPVSATPPSLPNFDRRPVNGVPPSRNGLMDAAAAVAANAINALGTLKSDPDAVAGLTASLMSGAARFQRTSQMPASGVAMRYGGTTSASATALVAQVAGVAQGDWSTATNVDLLNAIVAGAMKTAKVHLLPIAYGVAAGFAGTYVATGGSVGSFDINAAAADILSSFRSSKAIKSSNQANVSAAILLGLQVGLDQTNWSNPANGIAGIGGIENFTVVNGGGTPLTDTVGL